jgi:uncharacterized YigZ family protein
MSNHEPYLTVKAPAIAELTVERSRFIGHCQSIGNETEAKSFIANIRNKHAQATHNCYAYRIGTHEPYFEYFNDHGEPAGTAGKPILGAIQRFNLTNVVVVITRYFGGKKLGVRGLIEAYGAAASGVLEQAGSLLMIPKYSIRLTYGYPEHSTMMYRLQQAEAEVLETIYTDKVTVKLAIPEANRETVNGLLSEFPFVMAEYEGLG